MPGGDASPVRPVLLFTRVVGVFQAVLVTVAGLILYGWPSDTDRLFAWTIASPATASFMGASYLSAIALQLYAFRGRTWEERRVAVPAVFVFSVLTLVATVVHRDVLHFGEGPAFARVFAWTWFGVYIGVPTGLAITWVTQQRLSPTGSSRLRPLAASIRTGSLAIGGGLTFAGAGIFVAGSSAAEAWPWALSDLTAKVIGAWVVGVGLLAVHAGIENDPVRSRPGFAALGVAALAYASTILAHSDEVEWGAPPAWLYVAMVTVLLALSAAALYTPRRGPAAQP